MGGVSIISGTLFKVRQEPFLTSKIIMLVIIIFTFYKKKYYLISSLSGLFFLFLVLFFSHVTVHSVHSNVAKIHSRLPAAMEFWLVCLGILAYSCQNTSRDSGVWTVTLHQISLSCVKLLQTWNGICLNCRKKCEE